MKILFLPKARDATEFYRVTIPKKYLERAGCEVRVSYPDVIPSLSVGVDKADLDWADLVVFQRPASQAGVDAFNYLRSRRPLVPLIGDYDDDYFSVPDWNPGYPYIKVHEEHWRGLIPRFDGLTVSTPHLRNVMAGYARGPVEVIPNGFDFEMFDSLKPLTNFELVAPVQSKSEFKASYTVDVQQFNALVENKVVVCWSGSRFHFSDLDLIADGVRDVCKQDPDVVFLFCGYVQGRVVKACPVNRLFVAGGKSPISAYYSMLKALKIDIMMAPLHPCEFNRSKSNLKIMEAMALGAYPICSDWDPYEDDLDEDLRDDDQDVYGRLVGYEEHDWSKAILSVVEEMKSKKPSSDFLKANDTYVRTNHAASLRVDSYLKFYKEMIEAVCE